MMNTGMMAKTEARGHVVVDGLGTDILQGVLVGSVGLGAAVVGAWVVSCLVAAAITAGGPLALIGSWIAAVTGM
ncbi:MAG: hypothetical protein ACOY3Z_01325 [Thermodesulfobacteriota bacterium]